MIRVLIADDHPVVRQGLKHFLGGFPGLHVVAEARNGQECLALASRESPDVIILDITMPDVSGLDVLKTLKTRHPKIPVLIFSVRPEDQLAIRLLKAGAAGYVTKGCSAEELADAIRTVVEGRKYVSPWLAEKLAADLRVAEGTMPHECLSDREYEILCLIASGKRVKEIAGQLSLSVKTVSTYRARVLEKMGMRTNADLMRYAITQHLVD